LRCLEFVTEEEELETAFRRIVKDMVSTLARRFRKIYRGLSYLTDTVFYLYMYKETDFVPEVIIRFWDEKYIVPTDKETYLKDPGAIPTISVKLLLEFSIERHDQGWLTLEIDGESAFTKQILSWEDRAHLEEPKCPHTCVIALRIKYSYENMVEQALPRVREIWKKLRSEVSNR